ncbi:MAG: HTH domain-containing protein [Deinococcales bacterium]
MQSRQELLLELVVERFIAQKRPVPSQELASPLGVSSATVRNDLAALEEMGLLQQPHTSAGRIPTREGWRLYASKHIPPKPLPLPTAQRLESALGSVNGESRLRLAMQLTASLSGYAAVLSLVPKEARLEKLLLSNLEQGRILAILLLEGGLLREIILDVGFRPETEALERISNTLCSEPRSIDQVPDKLERLGQNPSPTVAALAKKLRQRWGELSTPNAIYSSGASPVLHEPESSNVDFLRGLLELLERPNNPSFASPGLVVRVDEPSGISSITVTFKSNLGRAAVSVVGPTRMRYPQAISVAQAVANILA